MYKNQATGRDGRELADPPREATRALGLAIITFAAMVTAAAAEEHYPVAVEVVAPVRHSGTNEAASETKPTPNGAPVVTVPLRPAVDEETYKAIKQKARHNPMAEEPDVLEVSQGSRGSQAPTPLGAEITKSFTGLDQTSAGGNPPDPIVGKSDTHVLEAANSALRLFTPDGTVLATKDLSTFFGAKGSEGYVFDPKVYFDRNASNRRFYVVALQKSGDSAATGISKIWFAVSRSADPDTLDPANWCLYSLNGRYGSSWADYPGLGIGGDWVVVAANQFTFECTPVSCDKGGTPDFTFATVRVVNKLIAADNASACPAFAASTFQPATVSGDATIFALQPVQHYTSPSEKAVYLMNTHFPTRFSSDVYKVWRMHNTVVAGRPRLTLEGPVNVTGPKTYDIPPHAPQSLSSVLLDTGDNRITQAAGIGDQISGVHGTVCNVGGGANQSCVRYVRIAVGSDALGKLTASLRQQDTGASSSGVFDFWPGVAVNALGDVVVAFHRSSATSWLSSFWKIGPSGSNRTFFGSAQPLVVGDCPKPEDYTITNTDGTITHLSRTGDYIGAQTDPSDFQSFWLAGERARMTPADEACVWRTRIAKVTPDTGP